MTKQVRETQFSTLTRRKVSARVKLLSILFSPPADPHAHSRKQEEFGLFPYKNKYSIFNTPSAKSV